LRNDQGERLDEVMSIRLRLIKGIGAIVVGREPEPKPLMNERMAKSCKLIDSMKFLLEYWDGGSEEVPMPEAVDGAFRVYPVECYIEQLQEQLAQYRAERDAGLWRIDKQIIVNQPPLPESEYIRCLRIQLEQLQRDYIMLNQHHVEEMNCFRAQRDEALQKAADFQREIVRLAKIEGLYQAECDWKKLQKEDKTKQWAEEPLNHDFSYPVIDPKGCGND